MNWTQEERKEFERLAIERYPKNFKENPEFANWILFRVLQILEKDMTPESETDWNEFKEFCHGNVNDYLLPKSNTIFNRIINFILRRK
jgi:hypothetical protein